MVYGIHLVQELSIGEAPEPTAGAAVARAAARFPGRAAGFRLGLSCDGNSREIRWRVWPLQFLRFCGLGLRTRGLLLHGYSGCGGGGGSGICFCFCFLPSCVLCLCRLCLCDLSARSIRLEAKE